VPEFFTSDGSRIHHEVYGDASASPLLLLEGMGGDIPGWRRNILHLSRELFVVAFDLRGNGLSDSPDEPMSMATFTGDVIELMDHLGLARAHIYGQSFGGMVAQELALTAPSRVAALILAATHCGGAHAVQKGYAVPKDRPYLALYSQRFAEEHPDHIAEDLEVGGRNPQEAHSRRRQWEAMQGFDSFDRLPTLKAPTLVLHGSEDRLVPAENAQLLADRIPGAESRILIGAGHLYHSEQADAADAAVLGFIRRHPDG